MAVEWNYGDAGDLYPMERGEVWSLSDRLWFAVGDLELGDFDRYFSSWDRLGIPLPTAMYVDPPWDKGIARTFRTKAFGKDNSRPVDFMGSLMPLILGVSTRFSGPCAMQMGHRHGDDVAALIARLHGCRPSRADITYHRRHPNYLYTFHSGGEPSMDSSLFSGLDDEETPGRFCEHLPSGSVLVDPCTGRGLTPFTAMRFGFGGVFMELNPRRLAVGVKRCLDHFGGSFTKVGSFLDERYSQ